MTTALNLIEGAYRLLGIANLSSTQQNNGLIALNDMLASWSSESLMVFFRTSESFNLTKDKSSYTIGTSGSPDMNTARPEEILDAFIRDSNGNDYPVDVLMSLEEYNEITDKAVNSRPTRLYYEPEYPNGKIYFNYEPESVEAFHLFSRKALSEFAALTTTVSLPREYEKALRFNLAAELAAEMNVNLSAVVVAQAIASKTNIEIANRPLVKPAQFDPALYRPLAGRAYGWRKWW